MSLLIRFIEGVCRFYGLTLGGLISHRMILCYHNVGIPGSCERGWLDDGRLIDSRDFENQLRWLKSKFEVVTLDQLLADGVTGKTRVAITFDDGPLETELKARVETLDITSLVNFTGRISNGPELIRLYDSQDVFCLPSKTEGTPRAIAESVARGLPVVASDVGSIRHMFSQGTVRLLDGFTAQDILRALTEFFDHLAQHREMARQKCDEAMQHSLSYNVDKVHRIIGQDPGESVGD